jgi:hypothetical protein
MLAHGLVGVGIMPKSLGPDEAFREKANQSGTTGRRSPTRIAPAELTLEELEESAVRVGEARRCLVETREIQDMPRRVGIRHGSNPRGRVTRAPNSAGFWTITRGSRPTAPSSAPAIAGSSSSRTATILHNPSLAPPPPLDPPQYGSIPSRSTEGEFSSIRWLTTGG